MSTGLTMKKTVLTCHVNKVGSLLYPVTHTHTHCICVR